MTSLLQQVVYCANLSSKDSAKHFTRFRAFYKLLGLAAEANRKSSVNI